MLSFFRQKGLSNVLYGAIIVATILTFVIEFRPNASQRTASLSEACAARVRGRCLDPRDFSSAYRILMPSHSAETSRRLNIKRVALDGLIERELLDDEARRLGISVTEEEVTDQLYSGFVRASVPSADPAIAQSILQEMYQSYARAGLVSQEVAMAHFNDRDTAIPVDFRDPKSKMFDMKVYERQVRNLSNRSTSEFRGEQARELLAAKMRDVVRAPIRVSEAEAWEEYRRQYDTATVAWIPVKESWAGRWAGANASAADVDAWVKEHQKEFDAELTERQAADAPKAGHLRHILVKLPYGATDEEKAAGLAKLSWAVARVRAGESFAEVARETSDDPGSAAQGGDLGDKTDSFVPAFKAAADALAPGQSTAGAVETQFGYHFIVRDDPAKTAEVAAQVKRGLGRSMYAKATATDAAKRVAGQIGASIHAGKTADDAIRDAVSGFVRTGSKVDRLRVLPGPVGDAGAPSAPRSSGDAGSGATASATPPAPLPEKTFDASVDADRPQVQTSSAFNRGGDPFPGLSPDGTTSVVHFALSAQDGDVMAEPVRTAEAFVVVQQKQHKTATRDEFDKNHDTFVQEIVRTKRDEALSLYVRRLREQAKDDIKIDASFVQEAKVDGGASSSGEDEDEY